jgi:hypothetical protein
MLRKASERTKVESLREEPPGIGIIQYLTDLHTRWFWLDYINVHEAGIVIITSKSADGPPDNPSPVANLANLDSLRHFRSKDEPGQWVCWNFQEMRLRPTHYRVWSFHLKSWVVESSLDGSNWTEIDRQTNNEDFKVLGSVDFSVSNPRQCRFIRLTQTGKRHDGLDFLALGGVEFFGTLFE